MGLYYPINIRLSNKKCLVVGGGETAERKTQALIQYQAKVTLISPLLTSRLEEQARRGLFTYLKRKYRSGDVDGCFLVIGATNSSMVNAQIAKEAESKNILVNVVDRPELCNFIVPAVVRQGPLCIAVSTGGKSPALAKKIRYQLEEEFGPEYAKLLDILGDLRGLVKEKYPEDDERRHAIWQRLVGSDVLELLRWGRDEEAKEIIRECTSALSA